MFIPSNWVLFAGALSGAVVLAADWYVWGLNMAVNPRQPRHPQPLTGFELLDLGLSQLVAANRAVLPKAVLPTMRANRGPVTTNPDDGFKRVA
jgi:hypothetical protein